MTGDVQAVPKSVDLREIEMRLTQICAQVPRLDDDQAHIRAKAANNIARYADAALRLVRGE